MKKITSAFIAALLLAAVTLPAAYADDIIPPTAKGHPLILGLGVTYNDKGYRGYDDDEKWNPVPLVMWENDKFFIRASSAGWKLYADETWEVAAVIEAIDYGYDSNDAEILEGLSDKDMFVGAGAHVIFRMPNGIGLKGTWVSEISDSDNGYEMRGEVFYDKKMGDWLLRPSAAIVYDSDDTVNYYYGVDESDAVPGIRPAYQGDETVNYRVQMALGWNPGGGHWQLFLGGRATFVGNEIDDSPLMEDSTTYMGFLAAGYRF